MLFTAISGSYAQIAAPSMVYFTDTSIQLSWSGSYDSFTLEMSENDALHFHPMYPFSPFSPLLLFSILK